MQPGLYPLASGSRGNALLLVTPKAKILIDCGLSLKALTHRLSEFNVDVAEIDALMITHDHTDHIGGIKTLEAHHEIPLIANCETAKSIAKSFKEPFHFKIFTSGEKFSFHEMEILPFSISHDAADPVGFAIHLEGIKIGFCTDLGFATPLVKKCLKGANYLVVEANHEPSMVEASSRPKFYKERVLSRSGHLSNDACAQLLSELFHPHMRSVTLAHLSQECNSPLTATQKVRAAIGAEVSLHIAYQEKTSQPILFS